MSDSSKFPTPGGSGNEFGSTGGGRDEEEDEISLRTSRDMKRKLEKVKDLSEHTSLTDVTSEMTENSLSDIHNMTKGVGACIDFAEKYEKNVADTDINVFTYHFDKNIITLGQLDHWITVSLDYRYSASLGMISTNLNINKADLVRMCFIKSTIDWYYSDNIGIDYTDIVDLEEKWKNVKVWSNSQLRKFMEFMYTYFIDLKEMSQKDIQNNIEYVDSLYGQLKSSSNFDIIYNRVGEEPFNEIEKMIG